MSTTISRHTYSDDNNLKLTEYNSKPIKWTIKKTSIFKYDDDDDSGGNSDCDGSDDDEESDNNNILNNKLN